MKKIIYCILPIIASMCLHSCYEDKGNYDYKATSELEITGMEKVYTKILLADKLEITPTIVNTNPSDKLEYLWTLYKWVKPTEEDNSLKLTIDTIGREKDLSMLVEHASGKYRVVYKVTNLSKGNRQWEVEAELNVVTPFSNGFYVMKEVADGSDLDLHTPENTVLSNILLKSEGRVMKGKPVSLAQFYGFSYLNEETQDFDVKAFINPITDQEVAQIRIEDMKILRDHKGIFYSEVPKETPFFFFNNWACINYISDKGYYSNYQNADWGLFSAGKFGARKYLDGNGNLDYALDYHSVTTDMGMLCYDTLNGQFLGVNFNGDLFTLDDSKDELKCSNIKGKLLFLGGSESGYALFEASDKSRKMYKLNASDAIMSSANPVTEIKNIDPSLRIATATEFAPNRKDASAFYFLSEGKLYMYDPVRDAEERIAPSDLGDGEITEFDTMYKSVGTPDSQFNYLYIATYNNGKYTVKFYETVGGKPYGNAKKTITGEGKARKVQFASIEQNSESRGKYSISY